MEKKSGMVIFLSGVYLLAAVLLLFGVCGYCYPSVGEQIRDAVAGLEDSPVRQAFSVMAEGMEAGTPLGDTISQTLETLFAYAG